MRKIDITLSASSVFEIRAWNADFEFNTIEDVSTNSFSFSWYDGLGELPNISVTNQGSDLEFEKEIGVLKETSAYFILKTSCPVTVNGIRGSNFQISDAEPEIRIFDNILKYKGIGSAKFNLDGVNGFIMRFDAAPEPGVHKFAFSSREYQEVFVDSEIETCAPLLLDSTWSPSCAGEFLLAFREDNLKSMFKFTFVNEEMNHHTFSTTPLGLSKFLQLEPMFCTNDCKRRVLQDTDTSERLRENLALEKLAIILNSIHSKREFTSDLEGELGRLSDEELDQVFFEVYATYQVSPPPTRPDFIMEQEHLIAELERIMRRK